MVALEQCSRSVQLEDAKFPGKFMILLGNERLGAPSWLLNEGDILVEIPQIGKIRSLNVHVSMVLCFWEYLSKMAQWYKTNTSINITIFMIGSFYCLKSFFLRESQKHTLSLILIFSDRWGLSCTFLSNQSIHAEGRPSFRAEEWDLLSLCFLSRWTKSLDWYLR